MEIMERKKPVSNPASPKIYKSVQTLSLKKRVNEVAFFTVKLDLRKREEFTGKMKRIKWADFSDEEFVRAKDSIIELIENLQSQLIKTVSRLGKSQLQLESEEKFWKESDETKADFLSLVSHQLRTPLTVALLNTEMLLTHSKKMPIEQKKSLEEIFESLTKITEMLNVFSIVSKVELNNFIIKAKLINLTEIVDSIFLDISENNKDENLNININHDQKNIEVEADPDLIKIVFKNLMTFSVKNVSGKKKGNVEIVTCGDGVGAFISFFNDGPTIPEAEQKRIFDKGYRNGGPNKEDLSDIGLGFYISKTIIDRSGGRIWFESSPEKGTSFHVFLPKVSTQRKLSS